MSFAARYDMAVNNATFDFFIWAAHVKLLGATSIVFGTKEFKSTKWGPDEIRRRYESICKPGAELCDLPYTEGDGGIVIGTHKLQGLLELKNWDFPRIKSKLPPGKERFTVTIRNTQMKTFRNSDEALWRSFAREIGAYVIEDYSVKPISLFDRVALYAGAQMNFGVVNGPMGLLYMTPYPMMMFDCSSCEHAWKKHGIWPDQQIPWMLPGQSLVWAKPTIESLREAVAKL